MVRDRNLSARARQHLDRPGADRQSVVTLAHCGTLGRPACQDITPPLHVLMDHKRDRLTTLKRASPPTDRTHRSTLLIAVDPEHRHDRTAIGIAQGTYMHEAYTLASMGGDTTRIEQALIALVRSIEGRAQVDPTDQIAQAWADGGSFIIDTTGVGKGIADHVAAKGYAVTYFDSSTPVRDKRYGNPRAEAYMTMREAFQSGAAAIPPNEELVAELLAVKYEVKSGGRTYIESKDKIRDRLGQPMCALWRSVARPKPAALAATSAISAFERKNVGLGGAAPRACPPASAGQAYAAGHGSRPLWQIIAEVIRGGIARVDCCPTCVVALWQKERVID